MPIRSGMAVWTLVAVVGLVGFAPARRAKAADEPSLENKVVLELQISGIGREGCSLEIKPAHSGCSFKKVKKSIEHDGEVIKLDPIEFDAKSTSADHDCSFAITITEPGQKPKTYRRGLQLKTANAGAAAPTQTLKCHLSTPSLAAKDEGTRPRR